MGCAISWLAVKELGEATLLGALRREKTGESSEYYPLDQWSMTRVGDWLVVCAPFGELDEWLPQLGCPAIVFNIEEHVDFVSIAEHADGTQRWSVTYGDEEPRLSVNGPAPRALKTSMDDGSDEPVQIGRQIVGYAYDDGDHTYELLRPVARPAGPPSKPWWRFW